MRVVIDTNVIVSAILKSKSVPATAIRLVFDRHTLLTSLPTVEEVRRVLTKPYLRSYVNDEVLNKLYAAFSLSERVTIAKTLSACRDPMDDKFLELAVSGCADVLISGDKDLLSMGVYENTRIMTPTQFLILCKVID